MVDFPLLCQSTGVYPINYRVLTIQGGCLFPVPPQLFGSRTRKTGQLPSAPWVSVACGRGDLIGRFLGLVPSRFVIRKPWINQYP